MAYYYGFVFAIIVNSIIWFAISTLINKYYWKYAGFKEEFQLVSKYIGLIKKRKSKNDFIVKDEKHFEKINANSYPSSNDKDHTETDNMGSPLKF